MGGGHSTKKKNEEANELNTTAENIVAKQHTYIKDSPCTSGGCAYFTNYGSKYNKHYKNIFLYKYEFIILLLIYISLIILFMLCYKFKRKL